VGVIISTLLIQFYGWTGFDPIASLFIAILIAASVVPLVMDTGRVLALDVADRDADIRRALAEVCLPSPVAIWFLIDYGTSFPQLKASHPTLHPDSGRRTAQHSLAQYISSWHLLHLRTILQGHTQVGALRIPKSIE